MRALLRKSISSVAVAALVVLASPAVGQSLKATEPLTAQTLQQEAPALAEAAIAAYRESDTRKRLDKRTPGARTASVCQSGSV